MKFSTIALALFASTTTILVSITSAAVNDGVRGSIDQTQIPHSLDFTSYAAKQTPKDAEKQQKGKEPSAILDGIRADDKLVDTEDLSFASHRGNSDISLSLTAPTATDGLVQSAFWLVLQPITITQFLVCRCRFLLIVLVTVISSSSVDHHAGSLK